MVNSLSRCSQFFRIINNLNTAYLKAEITANITIEMFYFCNNRAGDYK